MIVRTHLYTFSLAFTSDITCLTAYCAECCLSLATAFLSFHLGNLQRQLQCREQQQLQVKERGLKF
jgi:hypothetical protein